jgi:2-methylcitrate dehydratase
MAVRARLLAAGKSADDISSIQLSTHEACLRIIDKKGPLNNPADRDHCVQYMVAVPLIFGHLTASDYEDSFAADPRIDNLREKMQCSEEPAFTADYHDPEKRSIANSLTVTFSDGITFTETVEYPLGHRRRRSEGIPLLEEKFRRNLARQFSAAQQQEILKISFDQRALETMPVQEYVDLYLPRSG